MQEGTNLNNFVQRLGHLGVQTLQLHIVRVSPTRRLLPAMIESALTTIRT